MTDTNTHTTVTTVDTDRRTVKCVVWDLDNTLWRGVLLEDEQVTPVPEMLRAIQLLDERGILQSISSKNDPTLAMARLTECGIAEYFIHPAISWGPKSASIASIATALNLGIDAFAFVDDQPFERDEVSFAHPTVICLDPSEVQSWLARPEFNPPFITEDSRRRRQMYLSDIERQKDEDAFSGSKDAFLSTLGMQFEISDAGEDDLQRAEELTVRTHQLNTTGYTYSYDELRQFIDSPRHRLLICSLTDKYGSYGKIGLALVECDETCWTLKLLLMSCRVMSRGVGTILLNHLIDLTRRSGARLRAEFVETSRNRMMYVTYTFLRFTVVERRGNLTVFENDCQHVQPHPSYVDVVVHERRSHSESVAAC